MVTVADVVQHCAAAGDGNKPKRRSRKRQLIKDLPLLTTLANSITLVELGLRAGVLLEGISNESHSPSLSDLMLRLKAQVPAVTLRWLYGAPLLLHLPLQRSRLSALDLEAPLLVDVSPGAGGPKDVSELLVGELAQVAAAFLDCSTDMDGQWGRVGPCGLAGWLLEYPCIYCLPGDDSEDAGTSNCLGMVPLRVCKYGLSLDGIPWHDAFSFSHPLSIPATKEATQAYEAQIKRRAAETAGRVEVTGVATSVVSLPKVAL